MTPTEQFFGGLAATVAVNAALLGAAWGTLRADLRAMKEDMTGVRKALGMDNGGVSTFMRADNCELVHRQTTDKIEDVSEVQRVHEVRLHQIEGHMNYPPRRK